jgi:23S rRNA pseudouridine2605 synthase
MQEQQLQELRREKWHLNGRAVRTLDEAREFIDSVGFCMLYPQRPPVLAPTFVGAFVGAEEKLPTWQTAFADPRAREAKHLMVRLLREKAAYEANVFAENNFLVSASVFPYFYGLVGDRNPKLAPKANTRAGYSPLAVDSFQIINKHGPIAKQRLREMLGKEITESALDRSLDELWAKLRITRVDYNQEEGVFWDVLFRWSPDAVKEGMHVSVAEALTALVSKYLDGVLAAQQEEIENFFSPLIGRARVREAVNALQAARELSFVHVGGRVLMQVSSLQATQPPESAAPERTRNCVPKPSPSNLRQMPLVQRSRRGTPGKSTKPKANSEE